jgi:hypothetical protein
MVVDTIKQLKLKQVKYNNHEYKVVIDNYKKELNGHMIYVDEQIGHKLIGYIIGDDVFTVTMELNIDERYSYLILPIAYRYYAIKDKVYLIDEKDLALLML